MNESIDGKIINWWHTREDTFDKVDPEVALRDTRVIGEPTAFFANCGKLPADMSGFVDLWSAASVPLKRDLAETLTFLRCGRRVAG